MSALFGAVLGRVLDEARTLIDEPPDEVVVTCPAAWGSERRAVLLASAPPGTRLVSEPVAAAHYFVDIAGQRIPEGRTAVVYDFGAGTFDASVVRRVGDGFETVASCGLPDSGGLDIDAAIVAHLAAATPDPELWHRLNAPSALRDRRARQQLWDNVRAGKEMLSRASSTWIHLPLLETEVPLGRETLDRLAAPVLDRTVATTREALARAGVGIAGGGVADVAAIFLAGGSSRMPIVVTTLHRAFGIAPVTVDQPELAVAEGSLRTAADGSHDPGDWPGPPAQLLPVEAAYAAGDRPGRNRRLRGAAAAGVLLAVVAAAALANAGQDHKDTTGARLTTSSRSAKPSVSPSPSYPPGVDPCLLGTWRTTTYQNYGLIDNVKVQYTGGGGSVFTYLPDGTSTSDYGAAQPMVATYKGNRWEDVARGTVTMHYTARDGVIQSTVVSSTLFDTLTRNGKYNNSGPATFNLETQQYTCIGDSLRWTSTQGNFAGEAVRVAPPTPITAATTTP